MSTYDADQRPQSAEWLEIDESERLEQIVKFHESLEEDAPESGWNFHAAIHCVVENQIALEVGNVASTEAKLIRQGLSRHDAIHAISSVVGADILDIAQNKSEFDIKRYRGRLEKLTAKRWLKGKY